MKTLQCLIFLAIVTMALATKNFTLFNVKSNWFGAHDNCQRHQMRLAVVDSAAKQSEIELLIGSPQFQRESFWIDATDLASPGKFVWWNNGDRMQFRNWASGQPGGSTDSWDHCVQIEVASNFRWTSIRCERESYFLCELTECGC